MAGGGELIKMIILAFETAKDAEQGGILTAKDVFKALINPESYTRELKLNIADNQAQGTSGTQSKFNSIPPEELTLEFLFDNTGIISLSPGTPDITLELTHFRDMLMKFRGDTHETYHLKLIWGNLIFKGRAVELSITYKLFNAAGLPIRAVAKVKFKASIEEEIQQAQEDRKSPDLTHERKVKAGDTLPLMCHHIYGHPKYYLDVAEYNGINHFSALPIGAVIKFPPLPKTADHGRK